MSYSRLSAQDASFVYGEDQRIPLHVGGLGILEAGPLRTEEGRIDLEEIRAAVGHRLHLLPLFRQKLAELPFDQARPVWVDDRCFRIENHIHEIALSKPGGRRELLELMGRLQAQVLDRNRPLWEIVFVDGLEDSDSIAMITRIHHSVIDGTSGVELAKLLFDVSQAGTPHEPPPWQPGQEPGTPELLMGAVADQIYDAIGAARTIFSGLRNPAKPITHARNFMRSLSSIAGPIDVLPFNARVSSRRAFYTLRLPLQQVIDAKDEFGVTLNEIVLAAVSGALRDYCEGQGIDPDSLGTIRAICPVDNREEGDVSPGSDVAGMFVSLPVGVSEPAERVISIARESSRLKALDVADGSNMWGRATSVVPAPLLRLASHYQFRGLMANGNLLVSNVRGPEMPLYCLGGEVREFYPYFGVQDGVGLNVMMFSYQDHLHLGVACDPELMAELDEFGEAIRKSFAELAAVV
jgi:diacylglycerol O-acyltransferase